MGLGMVTSGILSALALPLAQAAFFTPAPSPDLDLDPLGRITLTGNFDAVSLYSFIQDKEGGPASSNGSQSQSIIATLPDGGLVPVFSADADILAMCPLTVNDSSSPNIVVGGNFTSLGGIESQGIALFDPDSTSITAIPGLSGQVLALYCDEKSSTVYIGGDFRRPNSTNAMTWSPKSGLSSLPFGGFNGPVHSIVPSYKGRVLFGGSFYGLGNMSTSPSQKDEQLVNLGTAEISTSANSPVPGFDDPLNVICPGGDGEGEEVSTWLLPDASPGFWRADMKFGYRPTKLRVWNTHVEGRGTKTFRFKALPDNGILNMTFTDPESGDTVACDARCPLSDNPKEEFRDFSFVNVVGMSGFELVISDWYGKGAGLNGVELFEDDIYAHAVDDFNEPSCAGVAFGSKATKTGEWNVTPSQQSSADYLTSKVDPSKDSSTSVTLQPDIKRTGNFSVIIYTPGCVQDGTCATRGTVNVTGIFDSSVDEPVQTSITQTNNFDKYDEIYFGHVDRSSDKFRPSVKIAAQGGPGEIDIVASRVKFQQISSSGGLNGLYEFDPSEKEVSTEFSESAMNKAGTELDPSARVDSLEWADDTLFVGGNFSNSSTQNIFSLTDGKSSPLPDGGLDSGVNSLLLLDDLLYVGGNFSNTAKGETDGLESVAIYDTSDKSWLPLGSGVNGPVTTLARFPLNISSDGVETTVAVSGTFTEINKSNDRSAIPAEGFAVWVPSQKKWLQELNVDHMAYVGQLSTSVKMDNETLMAGNLASGGMASRGAASLTDNDGPTLRSLPIDINLAKSDSPTRKRFIEKEYVQGVITGLFDKSSNRNLTILAGHFSATATDDSTINNLLFLDGADEETVTGAGSGIEDESIFLALGIQKDLLFAGGIVSGEVADSEVKGLAVYDLTESEYFGSQPAILDGENVVVRSISPRPDSDNVYVGGDFQSAGALPCPAVCIYEIEAKQWSRPGSELRGNVSSLMWATNDKLIAAGNLTVSGNQTTLATYDTKEETWSVVSGKSSENINGEITALGLATHDGSQIWISGQSENGSTFLVLYNGKEFLSVGSLFGDNTAIQGIQILVSKEDHDDSDFLEKNQVLLVTGRLHLPDFGIVSGALYNGTGLAPFILSSTADGEPGSITGLFSENKVDLARGKKPRSIGIVVLVSFCIALGCVFLIVLLGILLGRIRRYRQGYVTAPQGTDRKPDLKRVPPEYLLDSLRHRTPGVPTV